MKIAVIGAGPAGLTLARLLQVQRIGCKVFESDESRSGRSQGGTLDIHEESGQQVLKKAGLLEAFRKKMRVEGEEMKILNILGKSVMGEGPPHHKVPIGNDEQVREDGAQQHGPPSGGTRPEIDRIELRNILLDSLDPSTIQWKHKLLRVESTDDNRFDLHFELKVEKGYDMVVGADGAWSKVRSLLTNIQPFYSGITGAEARIANVNDRFPDLAKRVGQGSCFQLGESKGLLSQRNGDGSIRTYATLRVPEDWSKTSGINWDIAETAKTSLVENEFGAWDEEAKNLILKSDGNLVVRPLYMLPVGLKWDSLPGVTVIGDAAHLMTPFAGEGVNLAMVDALELSQDIIPAIQSGDRSGLAEAIVDFESKMFKRAERHQKETLSNMEMMFNGETAEEIAMKMMEMMAGYGQHHE